MLEGFMASLKGYGNIILTLGLFQRAVSVSASESRLVGLLSICKRLTGSICPGS